LRSSDPPSAAADPHAPRDADNGAAAEDTAGTEASHPLAQDLLLNPKRWSVWPAVAVLRWLLRESRGKRRGLVYRSKPSLSFSSAEIEDVLLNAETLDILLTAPGLATWGTALPAVDVARIVADYRPPGRGAMAVWLDGPGDRLMQAVEMAKSRFSASFTLATGGAFAMSMMTAELAGRTAPLKAAPGHRLAGEVEADADGAIALAAYFLGPPSAAGLAALVRAFTGLPARVREFAGTTVRILRPIRFGQPLLRMLGENCEFSASGLEIVIDGGVEESAPRWAKDWIRRNSLHRLCREYIGMPSIAFRIYLDLAPENTEPATLGRTDFGGMAVLGQPSARTIVPLAG